jgi:hypothetical protein
MARRSGSVRIVLLTGSMLVAFCPRAGAHAPPLFGATKKGRTGDLGARAGGPQARVSLTQKSGVLATGTP